MSRMKLFHSHDYNAGNSINPFDEVFHIVHKKMQDVKNGLNFSLVRIPQKLICSPQEQLSPYDKFLEFYKTNSSITCSTHTLVIPSCTDDDDDDDNEDD